MESEPPPTNPAPPYAARAKKKRRGRRCSKAERLAKRTGTAGAEETFASECALAEALVPLLSSQAFDQAEVLAASARFPASASPTADALGPELGPAFAGGVVLLSLLARGVSTTGAGVGGGDAAAILAHRRQDGKAAEKSATSDDAADASLDASVDDASAGLHIRVRTVVHFAVRFGQRLTAAVAAAEGAGVVVDEEAEEGHGGALSITLAASPDAPLCSAGLSPKVFLSAGPGLRVAVARGLLGSLLRPLVRERRWEAAAAVSEALGIPEVAAACPPLRIAIEALDAAKQARVAARDEAARKELSAAAAEAAVTANEALGKGAGKGKGGKGTRSVGAQASLARFAHERAGRGSGPRSPDAPRSPRAAHDDARGSGGDAHGGAESADEGAVRRMIASMALHSSLRVSSTPLRPVVFEQSNERELFPLFNVSPLCSPVCCRCRPRAPSSTCCAT